MSEKRKPIAKLFAERNGKRAKVEIFPASLFSQRILRWRKPSDRVFRLRVNGKWFPEGDVRFFNRTEIRDIFWRSFHFQKHFSYEKDRQKKSERECQTGADEAAGRKGSSVER